MQNKKITPEIIEFLIDLKADLTYEDRANPCYHLLFSNQALLSSQKRFCKIFYEMGAKINLKNGKKETFFHKHLPSIEIELIQFFLDKKFDINSRDYTGRTPLYSYIEYNSNIDPQKFILLLNYGADPNIPNDSGMYLVNKCSTKEKSYIKKNLLMNGAKDMLTVSGLYFYFILFYYFYFF